MRSGVVAVVLVLVVVGEGCCCCCCCDLLHPSADSRRMEDWTGSGLSRRGDITAGLRCVLISAVVVVVVEVGCRESTTPTVGIIAHRDCHVTAVDQLE